MSGYYTVCTVAIVPSPPLPPILDCTVDEIFEIRIIRVKHSKTRKNPTEIVRVYSYDINRRVLRNNVELFVVELCFVLEFTFCPVRIDRQNRRSSAVYVSD